MIELIDLFFTSQASLRGKLLQWFDFTRDSPCTRGLTVTLSGNGESP